LCFGAGWFSREAGLTTYPAHPPVRRGAIYEGNARLRELLLYITEQTLRGRANLLTEHEIGHAIFGKPADYSPLEDSSVRAQAVNMRPHPYEFTRAGT
jgi:hypothetical protein